MKTNEQKNQDKEKRMERLTKRLSGRRQVNANFIWWSWKFES